MLQLAKHPTRDETLVTATLFPESTYLYDKLSAEAKERAKEWFRENHAWDEHDSHNLSEWFAQELELEYGMEGMQVWWSLSSCQGDGVSFEGEPSIESMAAHDAELHKCIDAARVLLFLAGREWDPEWRIKITHTGRCYGWGNMSVEVYCETSWGQLNDLQDTLDGLAQQAAERVCEICSAACKRLERDGYREIKYHQGDEYVEQCLADMDYLFDEDGEPKDA